MSAFPMSAARLRNLVWPLASCAVLAAVTTVQHSLVPGKIEVTVRLCADALGLAGVPALLVLASQDWFTKHRAQLRSWRNGLGLSSIVVLFAVWLLYWGMWLVSWIRPISEQYPGTLEWIALLLDSTLIGFVLAFALRGTARPQVISAALLMWACVQAGIYF